MAWVKETGAPGEPGYTREGAGEAAMSPQEAAARGYRWEGTGGTYGRAPTQAEYYGIIGEKQRMGHYAGKPAEEQVAKELERGRREHGEKGPPWGTPAKWHPYIKRGQFVSPDVEAFEARWSPYITGDVFTGDAPQYAQYQREREAAYAAQEKAFGSYSLEMGFRQQRFKEEHERGLRQYWDSVTAAREYERGYAEQVHGELVKAQEQKRLHEKVLFGIPAKYEKFQSRVAYSPFVAPVGTALTELELRHLPEASKALYPKGPPKLVSFSTERTLGQLHGFTEKPVTAAGWFGATTAITLAAPGIGSVARGASGAFPKAAPIVVKYGPKALGYGMAAGYGYSAGRRLYETPPGERARAFGKIEATELMPMTAGFLSGPKLGRGVTAARTKMRSTWPKPEPEIIEPGTFYIKQTGIKPLRATVRQSVRTRATRTLRSLSEVKTSRVRGKTRTHTLEEMAAEEMAQFNPKAAKPIAEKKIELEALKRMLKDVRTPDPAQAKIEALYKRPTLEDTYRELGLDLPKRHKFKQPDVYERLKPTAGQRSAKDLWGDILAKRAARKGITPASVKTEMPSGIARELKTMADSPPTDYYAGKPTKSVKAAQPDIARDFGGSWAVREMRLMQEIAPADPWLQTAMAKVKADVNLLGDVKVGSPGRIFHPKSYYTARARLRFGAAGSTEAPLYGHARFGHRRFGKLPKISEAPESKTMFYPLPLITSSSAAKARERLQRWEEPAAARLTRITPLSSVRQREAADVSLWRGIKGEESTRSALGLGITPATSTEVQIMPQVKAMTETAIQTKTMTRTRMPTITRTPIDTVFTRTPPPPPPPPPIIIGGLPTPSKRRKRKKASKRGDSGWYIFNPVPGASSWDMPKWAMKIGGTTKHDYFKPPAVSFKSEAGSNKIRW